MKLPWMTKHHYIIISHALWYSKLAINYSKLVKHKYAGGSISSCCNKIRLDMHRNVTPASPILGQQPRALLWRVNQVNSAKRRAAQYTIITATSRCQTQLSPIVAKPSKIKKRCEVNMNQSWPKWSHLPVGSSWRSSCWISLVLLQTYYNLPNGEEISWDHQDTFQINKLIHMYWIMIYHILSWFKAKCPHKVLIPV